MRRDVVVRTKPKPGTHGWYWYGRAIRWLQRYEPARLAGSVIAPAPTGDEK